MGSGSGIGDTSRPTDDAPVDFRRIRIVEDPFSGRRFWLLIALGACSGLYWVSFSDPAPLIWFPVFLLVQIVHGMVVRRLPEYGPSRRMRPAIISQVAGGLCYAAMGLILWFDTGPGEMHAKLFSIFLLVSAALNAFSVRAYLPVQLRVDLVLMGFGVLCRAAVSVWQDPGAADSWMLGLSLLALYAYFVKAALGVSGLHERLHQSISEQSELARQRALTKFTGGVAHDFNNLLTVVLGNMELARLSEAPGERDALIDEATVAARRGAELTHQLLTMSRIAHLSPVSESPARLLEPIRQLAERMLDGRHRLEIDALEDLPAVYADPAKLQAALVELVRNAADAMATPGVIRISAEAGPGQPCKSVRFAVTDSGPGVPDDLRDIVFEPYFTTKPRGRGAGLGLPMVRGFVEQSDGELRLETPREGGTRVWLELPVSPDSREGGGSGGASGGGRARGKPGTAMRRLNVARRMARRRHRVTPRGGRNRP